MNRRSFVGLLFATGVVGAASALVMRDAHGVVPAVPLAQLRTTPLEVGLYGPDDPYRWDVDNRPLYNLIENDKTIRAWAEAVSRELAELRGRLGLLGG